MQASIDISPPGSITVFFIHLKKKVLNQKYCSTPLHTPIAPLLLSARVANQNRYSCPTTPSSMGATVPSKRYDDRKRKKKEGRRTNRWNQQKAAGQKSRIVRADSNSSQPRLPSKELARYCCGLGQSFVGTFLRALSLFGSLACALVIASWAGLNLVIQSPNETAAITREFFPFSIVLLRRSFL